jgi:hypothetical protein
MIFLKRTPTWLRNTVDYLAPCAWAFWIGGFSFYFGVVIRVGSEVVGDSSQGFVTQIATGWLNIAALVALVLLLSSSWLARSWLSIGVWVILVICQAILFVLHARLDAVLDTASQTILALESFPSTHEWYEFISAIQWLFAMIYLGCWLASRSYRWSDDGSPTNKP